MTQNDIIKLLAMQQQNEQGNSPVAYGYENPWMVDYRKRRDEQMAMDEKLKALKQSQDDANSLQASKQVESAYATTATVRGRQIDKLIDSMQKAQSTPGAPDGAGGKYLEMIDKINKDQKSDDAEFRANTRLFASKNGSGTINKPSDSDNSKFEQTEYFGPAHHVLGIADANGNIGESSSDYAAARRNLAPGKRWGIYDDGGLPSGYYSPNKNIDLSNEAKSISATKPKSFDAALMGAINDSSKGKLWKPGDEVPTVDSYGMPLMQSNEEIENNERNKKVNNLTYQPLSWDAALNYGEK
jgi:hypothetical protein